MSKQIKIFVDGHSFDKEPQGTQTFVRELYNALLKSYPDVDVYIGAYDTEKVSAAFPMLAKNKVLKYKHVGIRRMFSDIPGLIKKHQFDFAHFQYISPAQIKGCKYIVTLHDILFQEMPQYFSSLYVFLRTIFFKRSFIKARVKTTISGYSRDSISKHYGIPVEKIQIIPNAVNEHFIENISRSSATLKISKQYGLSDFILYVSRIEPRKNHLLLLKTYLQLELNRENIALVFVGKPSIEVPELSALLSELRPEQKQQVHFLNEIPQEDLVAFYASCRLFVYPSVGEGFGIPPLEAAVCGAPVLCSNVSAMRDFKFFEPYTFDPADEKDFKTKLLTMINNPVDPGFTKQISEKIFETYNWEKCATALYNIIKTETNS